MFRFALLLAGLMAAAESALPLVPFMKPCSRNDPNFDECTLKHGIDAIPDLLKGDSKYGIPVLNPMTITELKIEDADKDNKPTGIDIIMRDLKIYGLDHVVLSKARFDLKNKNVEVAGTCPQIWLIFKYEIKGKVLVLPIVGNGDGMINMTDVDISFKLNYDLVKREDGLEYVSPGDHKLTYDTKSMIWNLDNLFGGDKTLGDSTVKFLNENWDVMNAELGPYLAEAIGEVINQILSSVTKLVPYDSIFPEKV